MYAFSIAPLLTITSDYSWIALVNMSGIVVADTGGIFTGRNMSNRTIYKQGLVGSLRACCGTNPSYS